MMFDLNKKVVLVVGGRGYLGQDLCHHLKRQNAIVISADLESKCRSSGTNTYSDIVQINVDVTCSESVRRMVADVLRQFKKIDVFIFSVTIKPDDFYLPFTECSLAGWQFVINTELNGAFLVMQAVGRVMEKQKSGSMILISSIYGVVGNDQRIYEGANLDTVYAHKNKKESSQKKIYSHAVYAAVKGGLISFARYLAAYWGELNIRVNCISPGGIAHPSENETFVKKYSERVPLGRKARVDEMAGAVVYLASDESSYVTGQNLIVDGGWTAW